MVETRLGPESLAATTAAVADNAAAAELEDAMVEVETEVTVEEGAAADEAEETTATEAATAAVAVATTTAAEALLLLLRLEEDDIGALAGGGKLFTKGLLLSRSARR